MLAIGDTILRGVNFVFLIIALGLTGSLAATTISQLNPQVNFAVFAAAFAILTNSFFGIFAFLIDALAWPVLLAALDFLNFVFLFAAATAVAAGINVHSCSDQDYLDDNSITQGSSGRCRKAQASAAFLYFSTFIFIASLIFSVISVFNGPSVKASKGGLPSMSQV